MKSLKTLALAGVLAGGIAGLASAANTIQVIHLSGAPAYRQDTIRVINAVVAGFPGAGVTGAYSKVVVPSSGAVDPANASAEQWYIPNFTSTTDLVISLSLTGGTAGIESVSSGSAALGQLFIPDAASTAALIGSPNYTGTLTPTATFTPDFTFSDTYQATTPFSGTLGLRQTSGTTRTTYTFSGLSTSGPLAVEPYVWAATPGFPVSNVTTEQLANLYVNGALPLSFFTGNASDAGSTVYALSRDPGSGSRLIALTELGLNSSTTISTYQPTVSGATADSLGNFVKGTISGAVNPYAKGVIKSTQIYDGTAGDTGYPSFADATQNQLLAAITSTPTVNTSSPSTSEYFIAYFNPTDAAEAVSNGAVQLSFNGVSYSQSSPVNLENGQYTFWSYEQIQYAGTLSTQANTIFKDLKSAWGSTTLSTGLPLSAVNVSRTADGTYNANYIANGGVTITP